MGNIKYKITVDSSELDRLAIGARIFDKLDLSKFNNVFKILEGETVLNQKDIMDIIELVNGYPPNIKIR